MSDATAKKEERRKFQAIRGTRDLLPPETELWNRVEQTAHEVFATFGFGEIRLPSFEPTELFARAVGGGNTSSPRDVQFLSTTVADLAARSPSGHMLTGIGRSDTRDATSSSARDAPLSEFSALWRLERNGPRQEDLAQAPVPKSFGKRRKIRDLKTTSTALVMKELFFDQSRVSTAACTGAAPANKGRFIYLYRFD